MNFETWEPVYEAVLGDFGYDRRADGRARDALYRQFRGRETFEPRELRMQGKRVAIAGAGPSLEDDLDAVRAADAVVAASTAADRLLEVGFTADAVVTDLDKHGETVVSISETGVPVVVHAHGDNRGAVREFVPRMDSGSVVGTTQARPRPPVWNFGGFTDGDRAAFLAAHLGAAELTFPGWDFDDPSVGPEKARKLRWAERLLYWLECRREERFAVLDGRREGIDTSPLPI